MTPLARGILSSAKLGVANFAKYFMGNFNASYGINVPDDATLDMTNDFSACVFVYPNNRSVTQRVMGKWTVAGNNLSWAMGVDTSGNLFLGHSVNGLNATFFNSTINIPLATLSLIHFRLTGGTLYLGMNGASEQSTARGACFSGTAVVEIGKNNNFQYCNDFDITQPMLFNVASSLANFATIYNGGMPCKFSLIDPAITVDAVMAFELSSNDETVTDLSGTGNNGAFSGGSFTDGHLATWKIGPEVSLVDYNTFGFNGTNQYISTSFAVSGAADFGVSVWFVTPSDLSSGGDRIVLAAYSADNATRTIVLRVDDTSGGLRIQIGSSGGFVTSTNGAVPLTESTLYHAILNFDVLAKTLTLHLDNVSVTSVTWTGTFPSSPDLAIGARLVSGSPTSFYDASITEPLFINRLILGSERTELYNLGIPKLFSVISASITNDSTLAYEMNSFDNSLTDLSTGGNNGTANNGVTSDGTIVEFEII